MGPYDTEFMRLAHADRVSALQRAAVTVSRPRRPSRLRRRVANWLIWAGVRLASEPAPRTRAA